MKLDPSKRLSSPLLAKLKEIFGYDPGPRGPKKTWERWRNFLPIEIIQLSQADKYKCRCDGKYHDNQHAMEHLKKLSIFFPKNMFDINGKPIWVDFDVIELGRIYKKNIQARYEARKLIEAEV